VPVHRFWLIVAGTLVPALTGCVQDMPPILHQVLEDGRVVGDGIPARDTVVLLLYAPSDCLVCGSPVSEWRDWASTSPDTRGWMLVVSRSPSPIEYRHLAALRLAPLNILDRDIGDVPTPRVYWIVAKTVTDSAVGREQIPAFFNKVASWSRRPKQVE